MRCPRCKKENTLRSWEGPTRRMGVEVLAHGEKCSSCGETLFDEQEMERQEKVIAAAFVERGIQNGLEFKLVRKVIGLGELFAHPKLVRQKLEAFAR